MADTKVCVICKEEKSIELFPLPKNRPSRKNYCSACHLVRGKKYREENKEHYAILQRKYRVKRVYGLEWDEYNELLERQGGVCAICGASRGNSQHPNLHVDHCHDTGRVRGLLCGNCNSGLGWFNDDPQLIEKALQYLKERS